MSAGRGNDAPVALAAAAIRAGIPAGRCGRAEEIAATVAFLLSADAGYITGQDLRVDGGITRSV